MCDVLPELSERCTDAKIVKRHCELLIGSDALFSSIKTDQKVSERVPHNKNSSRFRAKLSGFHFCQSSNYSIKRVRIGVIEHVSPTLKPTSRPMRNRVETRNRQL